MKDIRKGRHSSSSLQRDALCPGAHNLCKELKLELLDDGSADSRRGDRVHLALETGETGHLESDEERDTYEFLSDKAGKAISDWTLPGAEIVREPVARMWNSVDEESKDLHSGECDEVYTQTEGGITRALIIDYKSGWADDVPLSPRNLQLRDYAALLRYNEGYTEITVCIIQKLGGKPELCTYREADLDAAIEQISGIITRSIDTPVGESLNPGESQCKYCPAQKTGMCPALRNSVTQMDILPNDIPGVMAAIPDDAFGALLDTCKAASKFIGSLQAEAKKRIQLGRKIPVGQGEEFYLKPGNKMRVVTDAQGAFGAFSDELTSHQFLKTVEVKIGKLEKEFKVQSGLKGKSLSEDFEKRLTGFMTTKQNASSLSRRIAE